MTPLPDWPKVHLNFPAYLPQDFLPSEMERVSYYRRLSTCQKESELNNVFEELKDRSGSLPQEVENLKILFSLRLTSRALGLSTVEELGDGRIRFEFADASKPKGSLVSWLLKEHRDKVRFEPTKQAFHLENLGSNTPQEVSQILRDLLRTV